MSMQSFIVRRIFSIYIFDFAFSLAAYIYFFFVVVRRFSFGTRRFYRGTVVLFATNYVIFFMCVVLKSISPRLHAEFEGNRTLESKKNCATKEDRHAYDMACEANKLEKQIKTNF